MTIGTNNTLNSAKPAASVESANNVRATSTRSSQSIVSAEDAPANYGASKQPSNEELQHFLAAFAKNDHVYGLINQLNNTLKSVFREIREDEVQYRMKQYVNQFDIALDKRDEVIKAADEIYKVKMEAADMKMKMGYAKAAMGLIGMSEKGPLMGAIFQSMETKIEKLGIEADDIKMRLDASTTETDAHLNSAKQQSELSAAFVSMLDNLNSTFSSLINDLHASQSSTVNSMGKGMV